MRKPNISTHRFVTWILAKPERLAHVLFILIWMIYIGLFFYNWLKTLRGQGLTDLLWAYCADGVSLVALHALCAVFLCLIGKITVKGNAAAAAASQSESTTKLVALAGGLVLFAYQFLAGQGTSSIETETACQLKEGLASLDVRAHLGTSSSIHVMAQYGCLLSLPEGAGSGSNGTSSSSDELDFPTEGPCSLRFPLVGSRATDPRNGNPEGFLRLNANDSLKFTGVVPYSGEAAIMKYVLVGKTNLSPFLVQWTSSCLVRANDASDDDGSRTKVVSKH